MGKLANLLYAACDAQIYTSPPGRSLPLFILTLLGGSEVVEPLIRLAPAQATVEHVQSTIERLLRKSIMPESSLVSGLILAIDDVLVDCSDEMPKGASGWSPATQWLVRRGMLIDVEGDLRVVGECDVPAPYRLKQARADRERWCEVTSLILEEQHLEQAVEKELGDYES